MNVGDYNMPASAGRGCGYVALVKMIVLGCSTWLWWRCHLHFIVEPPLVWNANAPKACTIAVLKQQVYVSGPGKTWNALCSLSFGAMCLRRAASPEVLWRVRI